MLNNEKELLDEISRGNMTAFGTLMKHYSQGVYTLVVRIVGDDCDAEELAQDVWMKVYKQLSMFSGRSAFSTWLYRIAYNLAISFARHKRQTLCAIDENRLRKVSDDEVEQMEAIADNEQQIEALARAINRLDAEERALITLFYYEDRTVAECAEIMSQSENNIKVRLHRIRKKLYILLQDEKE